MQEDNIIRKEFNHIFKISTPEADTMLPKNTIGTSWLLNSLLESTKHNTAKCTGNRYNEDIVKYCTYFYIISGKLAYEFLSKNLAIPCLKTIQNHLKKDYETYIEGNV
jgi:hypothetical protein